MKLSKLCGRQQIKKGRRENNPVRFSEMGVKATTFKVDFDVPDGPLGNLSNHDEMDDDDNVN